MRTMLESNLQQLGPHLSLIASNFADFSRVCHMSPNLLSLRQLLGNLQLRDFGRKAEVQTAVVRFKYPNKEKLLVILNFQTAFFPI